MLPCFWVLTCHGRVLVLRGTMSLNETASDLTCEPEGFEPATSHPILESTTREASKIQDRVWP